MKKKAKQKEQSKDQLMHWRELIREAESSSGTRISWMKSHGISESTYYYWHRKLSARGLLGCTDIQDTKEQDLTHKGTGTIGEGQAFVEYPVSITAGSLHEDADAADPYERTKSALPQIMIEMNGLRIYLGDHFSENALRKVLGVAANA